MQNVIYVESGGLFQTRILFLVQIEPSIFVLTVELYIFMITQKIKDQSGKDYGTGSAETYAFVQLKVLHSTHTASFAVGMIDVLGLKRTQSIGVKP